MDMLSIAYDMIENSKLDVNQLNDFLIMMDDYKAQIYMDHINGSKIPHFENDLPF